MPLRQIGRALASIFRALLGMETSLLTIQQQGSTMLSKIAQLTAAYATLSLATTSALTELASLQRQHQDDLVKLSEQASASDDASIVSLVTDMQDRAQSIQDTIAKLHTTVSTAAEDAQATLGSGTDTLSGAGSDTIVGGMVDTVSGAAGSDTIAAGTADSVAGADTVAGSAGNATL